MDWASWSLVEWSFLISLIALAISLMALPTVFQMFCGGPNLQIELDDYEVENNKTLRCLIVNKPIRNRFLSGIGVIRQPTEILGKMTISEAGSGRIIADSIRTYLTTDKEHGPQVSLNSFLPARLLVAVCKKDRASFIVEPTGNLDSPKNIPLDRGRYRIVCTIYHSHYKKLKFTCEFLVGEALPDFYWTEQQARILQ
jgi:hypothetical protein